MPPVAVPVSEKAPADETLGGPDVERLSREYSELSTDADRKSFVDQYVIALTETYVRRHEQLSPATRTQLIELVAGFRDPRTEPALRAALETFVQHRPTRKADSDIGSVLGAAADLKLPGLSQPLIEAFEVFDAHTLLGGVTHEEFTRALAEVADPSWAPVLRAKLDVEMKRPWSREQDQYVHAYRDQLFWQGSAAKVLGIIHDREAVEPLLRALLDFEKGYIGTTVLLALVRIGKPARAAAAELLLGRRPDLVDYYEKRSAAAALDPAPPGAEVSVEIAAAILGSSGHVDARAPMLEFLKANPKPKLAVRVAKELAKLPPNEATKAAFKQVLSATPKTLDIWDRMPARAALLESAVGFYDPKVVDWCLDVLKSEVGQDERTKHTRVGGLNTALHLADRTRLPRLRRFAEALKEPEFQKQLDQVTALVSSCRESAACYLGELKSGQLPQVLALKAGFMVGMYGDEASRDAMIELLDSYQDTTVWFGFAQTIDRLTPNGSLEVVKKLQPFVDAAEASGDPERTYGVAPIAQAMARIDGRLR